MNASLFHRPINWIVVTGTLAKYIAIAPPERNEWQPISVVLNPNSSAPIVAAAALSFVLIWFEDICNNLPFLDMYVFTVDDSSLDGYDLILFTMSAQLFTGHKLDSGLDVLCMEIVLEFFFILLRFKGN